MCIIDRIEGMVKAFPQYVKKLDCGTVVVRAQKKTGTVALISGGGREMCIRDRVQMYHTQE